MSVAIETTGSPATITISDGTAASQYTSASTTAFLQRLYVIAPIVAIAVIRGSDATTAKTNYARQVLANPVNVVNNSISYAVVMDGSTGSASTDQDIATALLNLWTTLSTGYDGL